MTARPTVDGITLWGHVCAVCHLHHSLCDCTGTDMITLWTGDVDHLIVEHKALQAWVVYERARAEKAEADLALAREALLELTRLLTEEQT